MINVAFKQIFQKRIIEEYIKLFILAYPIVKAETLKTKKENYRRNQFVDKMKKLKSSLGITQAIGNCDEYDETYKTVGITDISFIFGELEDKKITFECKRFKDNTEICSSHVKTEYIGNGLNRFINGKYTIDFLVAGMVSFVESGDSNKCFNLLAQETNCCWSDESKDYSHNYVANSVHQSVAGKEFTMKHLVFDFN